jgi:hypothetical protein
LPRQTWSNGSYDKAVGLWRQDEEREIAVRVRLVGKRRYVAIAINDQEIYSAPSHDIAFWGMKIAALLDCDQQELILRTLREAERLAQLEGFERLTERD